MNNTKSTPILTLDKDEVLYTLQTKDKNEMEMWLNARNLHNTIYELLELPIFKAYARKGYVEEDFVKLLQRDMDEMNSYSHHPDTFLKEEMTKHDDNEDYFLVNVPIHRVLSAVLSTIYQSEILKKYHELEGY